MLYKRVTEILDMSRNKRVDLGVALNMCVDAGKGTYNDYVQADGVLKAYYEPITKCRRLGEEKYIKKICDLCTGNKLNELNKLVKEIKEL